MNCNVPYSAVEAKSGIDSKSSIVADFDIYVHVHVFQCCNNSREGESTSGMKDPFASHTP